MKITDQKKIKMADPDDEPIVDLTRLGMPTAPPGHSMPTRRAGSAATPGMPTLPDGSSFVIGSNGVPMAVRTQDGRTVPLQPHQSALPSWVPKRRVSGPPTDDERRFVTVYPHYLDGTIIPEQGRRVTKKYAPDSPSLQELYQAMVNLGFKQVYGDSNKGYSRAQSQAYCVPPVKGAVKVALDSGSMNTAASSIINKGQLLRAVGAQILAIPNRTVQLSLEQRKSRELVSLTEKEMQTKAAKVKNPKQKRVIVRR